jgi:hypothetical protein
MHLRRPLAALLVAWLLTSRSSFGDDLIATRFELTEEAHRVDLRLARGFATLVVHREVANRAAVSDQAIFRLDLPPGAVATRLRTSGLGAAGEPVWFEGDLMDALEAATKYHELTGYGLFRPKDPALLSWINQAQLSLQVFPVPPRATKAIEYTLTLPTRYSGGKYLLTLPALGTPEKPAVITLSAAHAGDRVWVNGVPVSTFATLESSRDLAIELAPTEAPRLEVALAEVPLHEGRVFVHERATIAPRAGAVPRDAAVAVVLDLSRSMGSDVTAELAAARAYLESFRGTGARVTVVAFHRRVSLPLGSSLTVAGAIASLASFAPQLENGSQIDEAITRADAELSQSGASQRRMLVVTDLRTRQSLTPERVAAITLRSGAIVHLATIRSGESSLERDDESDWSKLPRRTGGVFWHAQATRADGAAQGVFEEWARPKRLDHVKLKGFADELSVPESLEEGQGLEYIGLASAKPGELELDGELWSTPVHSRASSSADEERLWSALVFGSDALYQLTDDEQKILAMRGGAVSPVTSYLAIEPGVRPSTEGLLEEEGHGEGGGGSGLGVGLGHIGTIGHGSGSSFDPQRFLENAIAVAWRRCAGVGSAEVKLETTRDEVVDVSGVTLDLPSEPAGACLRDAIWAFDLPSAFVAEHDVWTVRIEG